VSTLVAITFPGADTAAQALGSIRSLEHAGGIKLEDTAVVTKDASGKIQVKNEASSGTETGAAVGAVLGSLLFVVFPIAGLVGGAIAGGLIGRSVAPGIDGKFVKEVEDQLPAGGSALFVLTQGMDPGHLIAAMRPYEGTVLQTSLDDDEEQALRDALKKSGAGASHS
jgi:uncharacterized membrane protein